MEKDIKKNMELSNKWMPRVLVIGPGGYKGLKALGFLCTLEDEGLFKNIDTYCGVSVGAIISLLIVAGYTIREIVSEIATLDLFTDLENFGINTSIENMGLISNEPIRRKLTNLLSKKFGTVPTLHNLFLQTGRSYISVTLNATDEQCEIMCKNSHPNVSCIDATMFSMNIPFLFYQLIYNSKIYVDGALANPYPIDYFDDGNTNILGIYMKTITTSSSISHQSTPFLNKINITNPVISCPLYALKIIHSLIDQRYKHIIRYSSSKCKHICLESFNINLININKEDKAKLLVQGYNEGIKFIESLDTSNESYSSTDIIGIIHKYIYPPTNSLN